MESLALGLLERTTDKLRAYLCLLWVLPQMYMYVQLDLGDTAEKPITIVKFHIGQYQ